MPQLAERTAYFTDSLIRRMTRIAGKYKAINLAQGFPDFDPPQELKEALAQVAEGRVHQYAITWGARNFRSALARKQSAFMGIDIDPETQITVTCGSTEAMICAMMATTNQGDKVIVFSPFYENYAADAILCGAQPIYVPLRAPDFAFRREDLEAAFAQRPKALVLCNPGNPTGKVFTREELLCIAELAERYDAFVITDEVYEHIVYPPYCHTYFASLPGMPERTLSCSSLSKTYSITGWRLGYVIASPEVSDAVRKVHDFLTVGAAAPLQEAAVVALNFPQSYYDALLASYIEKRDFFMQGLKALDLNCVEPQGAYYVMIDVSEFMQSIAVDSAHSADYDVAFCEYLAREIGVAAVPATTAFFRHGDRPYIRLHFAKQISTLEAALARLSALRK